MSCILNNRISHEYQVSQVVMHLLLLTKKKGRNKEKRTGRKGRRKGGKRRERRGGKEGEQRGRGKEKTEEKKEGGREEMCFE